MEHQTELLLLLAMVIAVVVRLIKSDKLDQALAKLGLPSIPKRALPWIAIALGLTAGVVDALLIGKDWAAGLRSALLGLLVGGSAVGGHEAVSEGLLGGRYKPLSSGALSTLSDEELLAQMATLREQLARDVARINEKVKPDDDAVPPVEIGIKPLFTAKDLLGESPPKPPPRE